MQSVEPTAGLTNILNDEVRRIVVLEPVLILEGIVNLRIRHRPGVKPYVQHVFDATHRRLTRWIIRVWTRQLINIGTVQIWLPLLVQRQATKVSFEFFKRSVNINTRIIWIVRNPNGNRRTPETVTRN